MERFNLLVLVRHGQSVRNAIKGDGRFVTEQQRPALGGVPDQLIELTATGRQQAYDTGVALCQRFGPFHHVYTSGYVRADQTVLGISAAYEEVGHPALRARTDALIRERDVGYTGDMTRPEALSAFPWLESYWLQVGDFLGRPPGGESMADVVARVQVFVDRILRAHPQQRMLVVTHGGTIQAFQFVLERWDLCEATERFSQNPPHNGSVTAYRVANTGIGLQCEIL